MCTNICKLCMFTWTLYIYLTYTKISHKIFIFRLPIMYLVREVCNRCGNNEYLSFVETLLVCNGNYLQSTGKKKMIFFNKKKKQTDATIFSYYSLHFYKLHMVFKEAPFNSSIVVPSYAYFIHLCRFIEINSNYKSAPF